MKKCCESFFMKFLHIQVVPDKLTLSKDGKIVADIDWCPMCGAKLPRSRNEETK